MKTISKSRKVIEGILKDNDVDMDVDGLLLQRDNDGNMIVTSPAPDGEPAHYSARTNTGGRRFVCWG